MNKKNIIYIVLFLLFAGCGNDSKTIEYHPIKSRIPYWESDVELIKIKREYKSKKEEVIIPEGELFESNSFLQNFDVGKFSEIKELSLNFDFLVVKSLNGDRMLLLDTRNNTFSEFNTEKKRVDLIASSGRGPGELMFASDLVINNDSAYVATKDSKILVFACNKEPCSYKRTIILDKITPVSVAAKDSELILMGYHNSLNNREEMNSERLKGIYQVDMNGYVKQSSGKIYDIEGHWMLLREFTDGEILLNEDGRILQYYHLFPQIMVFDPNLELKSIFRINQFMFSKRKYNTSTMRLWVNFEDWSSIDKIFNIGKHNFIVVVKHFSNRKVINTMVNWNITKDYYFLNLEKNTHYLLGKLIGDSKNIIFTKNHIIYQENSKYSFATFLNK